MSNLDPDTPRVTETRTTYDPVSDTTTAVTRTEVKSNAVAWWVAGAVAVVAILAVVFMVTRPDATRANADQIAAAADQGRAEAMAANANAALTQAQINAQNAQAAQASAAASLGNEADRAAQARADAEAAARRAALSAESAGRDASTTAEAAVIDAPPPQQ